MIYQNRATQTQIGLNQKAKGTANVCRVIMIRCAQILFSMVGDSEGSSSFTLAAFANQLGKVREVAAAAGAALFGNMTVT